MPESSDFLNHISETLRSIQSEGLMKRERQILGPQGARVSLAGRKAINLCANNYLGLADHPALIAAAKTAMDSHGFGTASVRFICGTQDLHRTLETRLARFLGTQDAITFASCFDANGALFEPLLSSDDAIISDSLNHASIIDGIRLSKARRYRFANADMSDLQVQLEQARRDGARHILIATDGIFSMDGHLAPLPAIRELGNRYGALVMVDDCHATGFIGPKGRGTPAHFGVEVDILTGTFGKALGGGLGGWIAGPQPVIDLLRQRARPYLFSNALPPPMVGAALAALDLVEQGDDLRTRLFENTAYWRAGLEDAGFNLLPGNHPIVPVMFGDARLAQAMAAELDARGIYVAGFFFPVVPRGQARIRTQMNACITRNDLDVALDAFKAAAIATHAL